MEIQNIELPKYVGDLEIVEGFIISLTKMPSEEHQKNMEEYFGWKFSKR